LGSIVPGASEELEMCVRAGLELLPERRTSSCAAFANALGVPLAASQGESLALSAVERPDIAPNLLEAIVKTAAGVFEAAACSIALVDPVTHELVYQAAWGAGAKEIVGVRLPPGKGLAGSVVQTGEAIAVPDCRNDPRFQAQIAAGTGYVPYTMLVMALKQGDRAIGTLSVLDRRDGQPYTSENIDRGNLFAELTVTALGIDPGQYGTLAPPLREPSAPELDPSPSQADEGTVVG
jgi:hypothetical protein